MDEEQIPCGKCRFFQSPHQETLQFGECRRCAPASKFSNSQTNEVSWPMVRRNDWCGEAKPIVPPTSRFDERAAELLAMKSWLAQQSFTATGACELVRTYLTTKILELQRGK